MANIEGFNSLGTFSTKETKRKFTEINRIVAEKEGAVIITNRGNPSTALISIKLIREILGDKAFKEFLFNSYYIAQIENRLENLIEGKEKTISVKELKKKMGR